MHKAAYSVIIDDLEDWWNRGVFATVEAKELISALHEIDEGAEEDDTLEAFPPELLAEVEALLVAAPTEKIRAKAVALLKAVEKGE